MPLWEGSINSLLSENSLKYNQENEECISFIEENSVIQILKPLNIIGFLSIILFILFFILQIFIDSLLSWKIIVILILIGIPILVLILLLFKRVYEKLRPLVNVFVIKDNKVIRYINNQVIDEYLIEEIKIKTVLYHSFIYSYEVFCKGKSLGNCYVTEHESLLLKKYFN